MKLTNASAILVALPLAFACASKSSPPARAPSSSEPDRCKGVYKPPICAGVDRRCEVDDNGCERCTCESPRPIAPGQ